MENKIDITPSFSQGTPGVYHYPSSQTFKHMGLTSCWRQWLKLFIQPRVRPRLLKSTHILNITPQEDILLAAEVACVWILNCELSFLLKDFVNAGIWWLATVDFPLTLAIIRLELLIHPSHFGQSIPDVPKVSSWTSKCTAEKMYKIIHLYISYSHSANGPWKKKFELYFPY